MVKQWGKSFVYLAVAGFTALLAIPMLVALPLTVMSVMFAGLGFVLFPLAVLVIRAWTDVHRRLVGLVLDEPVPSAFRVPTGGVMQRVRQVVTDSNTWRDIVWLVVNGFVGFAFGVFGMVIVLFTALSTWAVFFWWTLTPDDAIRVVDTPIDTWGMAVLVGVPCAVLGFGMTVYLVPVLARTHAVMSKILLSPSKLEARVEELTETRAGAVDAHEAELRRIERDLHDGTQARLVSIAMRLGVAEKTMPADDPAANLVREAREGAEEAMGELRDMIRTMYPPILSDRGLSGALTALGARCPVPVGVEVGDMPPVPPAVEAAAYYVVAEALTNVAKHSQATRASVRVTYDGAVMIMVADNGFGGVDEDRGTGVLGMRRRVAALDGTLTVDSPSGGPTVISVEVPCA
ncbi:sensor histidine kinase [Kibdelosporangium lantanae]